MKRRKRDDIKNIPDSSLRKLLIDDLIMFGRCAWRERVDGTIEKMNPMFDMEMWTEQEKYRIEEISYIKYNHGII